MTRRRGREEPKRLLNFFEEKVVRLALRPEKLTDEPGLLRLKYGMVSMMPEHLKRYMHCAAQVFGLQPGIQNAEIDLGTGELTLRYDPARLNANGVSAWVSQVSDAVLQYVKQLPAKASPSEAEVMDGLRAILKK